MINNANNNEKTLNPKTKGVIFSADENYGAASSLVRKFCSFFINEVFPNISELSMAAFPIMESISSVFSLMLVFFFFFF